MADNILEKIFQPSVRGRVWRTFILILLLAMAAGIVDAGQYYNLGVNWIADNTDNMIKLPNTKEIGFHLGLDLQGGTHLVYEADISQIPGQDKSGAVEGVRDVIERRVNVFGVSEPVVQTNLSSGKYQVIVELAGVKDVNQAIEMIGETPLLEFKEQSTEAPQLTQEQQDEINQYNTDAETRAEEVLGKIISGGNFSELAKEYSEDENSQANGGSLGYITAEDNPEIVNIASQLEIGEVTPDLARSSQGFEIIKLEDKRAKTNPFDESESEKEVMASHILICFEGAENCSSGLTREEAQAKINELKTEATPENFADLARENSTEPGAAASGGSLGWFSKGMMVAPFEEAGFNIAVGAISDVIETQFGFHLIYKQDERNLEEYRISRILIKTKTAVDITGPQEDWKNTALSGKNLKRAVVEFNPNDNTPEVGLEFDDEGAKLFEEITERNVSKPVAIFLDSYPISIPTVNEKITGGRAVISGKFNIQEAKLLAQRLNAGALPVPINLISQQTVGASLGHESLTASLEAGIIGLILVALFMIFYYRLPGLLAVFSLIIYGLLILAVFKLWPVTLTLAGMAGFILSIGMAVDANVLIFERLKEEFKKGQSLDTAIQEGFLRAWPSIRDGNVSTLITCFILIQFTTSIVKGFAITLGLGVVISMFSAIVITKNLLMLFGGNWLEKYSWLVGVKLKMADDSE